MTYLAAASVKEGCGYSVLLHSCGQSSRDLTVCGLTGRNWGPNPQYFALGNRFHSFETYRRKSVTMVPGFKKGGGRERKLDQHEGLLVLWHTLLLVPMTNMSCRCKEIWFRELMISLEQKLTKNSSDHGTPIQKSCWPKQGQYFCWDQKRNRAWHLLLCASKNRDQLHSLITMI